LAEIIDVISNTTGALNEANASNDVDKKGPWMRLYEGIFSPEFGVARGYQCPFVDGKLASRVKEKFINEWGPAAKKQMEADAAEGKQSSDSVMLMSSLFMSYNTFCLDEKLVSIEPRQIIAFIIIFKIRYSPPPRRTVIKSAVSFFSSHCS
jgi:hypothetical protein